MKLCMNYRFIGSALVIAKINVHKSEDIKSLHLVDPNLYVWM